jgi:hypothetical protein
MYIYVYKKIKREVDEYRKQMDVMRCMPIPEIGSSSED